ncbi:hypothetical protein ACQR1H_03210 [Bradyrhizobium sp. HKCCYLRH2015]|uniref:hypothetical protein n=1 Tax=Bradyrhizobium sp. HKCCYLRH2015 TaxID=3420742 RepID=UPI003EB88873
MFASAELVCVPRHQVPLAWPLVRERLRAAYLRTDLGHTTDLEHDVLNGDGLLWLAVSGSVIEAAAVTLLVRTDRHLVCQMTALGGANFEHWAGLLDKIEDWARAEGAAMVRIFGRKGWVRRLKHYRVSNVVLERGL